MRNINPLSENRLKTLRLLKKRSERHAQDLFIAEGERAVRQVLANGVLSVHSLVVENNRTGDEQIISVLQEAGSGIPLYSVSPAAFRRLADTKTAQGLLAVCGIPEQARTNELINHTGVLIAADRIQDPGNMGTIIRTAVWFGVNGLVVSPGTVDLFHPKVVRSTAGSTGVLPWVETGLSGFLGLAADNGWKVYLLDAGPDSTSLQNVRPGTKNVLVVGNEANGISEELKKPEFETIVIERGAISEKPPGERRPEGVESLNVSVAIAIAIARFRS